MNVGIGGPFLSGGEGLNCNSKGKVFESGYHFERQRNLSPLNEKFKLSIYKSILTLSRVHVHNLHLGANLHPGANLHLGANLHPLMSRSYANKLCSYTSRFDKKFNTMYSFLWEIRCV